MSTHEYHAPGSPDSEPSDEDLDLQELDPVTSASQPRKSPESRTPFHSLGARIPLRNLRASRRQYVEHEQEEDLRGLLHEDEDGKRDSQTSSAGDEEAPMLLTGGAGTKTRRKPERGLSKIAANLPSFVRSHARALSISQAQPQDEDEQDDHDPASNRTITVGLRQMTRFPPNAISNAKYTPWSFLPRTLYNEFSFFFNMYFLLVALSQIIPALRIGYLSTYIFPLAFVIGVTLLKEAWDDIQRRRRDAEANSELYTALVYENRETYDGEINGTQFRKLSKRKAARRKSTRSRLTDVEDEEEAVQTGASGPTADITEVKKPSKDIRVGDVLKLSKDQRVPADVVLLQSTTTEAMFAEPVSVPQMPPVDLIQTDGNSVSRPSQSEESDRAQSTGEAFIRTDQLDGETDWKLRLSSSLTQTLDIREFTRLRLTAGKPDKKVNEFVGTIELLPKRTIADGGVSPRTSSTSGKSSPLNIDNTAWANTVLASSSSVYAVVIYTGPQTRAALSTSASRSKIGLLEFEINSLTKILCALVLALSFILVGLNGFEGHEGRKWYVSVMRFLVLFSTIVPVSLRVNLDMGKTVYAWFIQRDKGIPDTIVRTSTIPEDLGRIEYLLSDKTGTLTQNEMEMKKVHVGTVSYANEAMEEVASYVRAAFAPASSSSLVTPSTPFTQTSATATRQRREIGSRVRDVVLALALCHNVTPITEEIDGQTTTSYQASSPDEIAIVRWTEAVGLRLCSRDRHSMSLQSVQNGKVVVRVKILNVFPFTSEGKRMGIVVQFDDGRGGDEEIWFYQKGADTVMSAIVAANDWLDEETANMAREGLRTLVVGRKRLTAQSYVSFSADYTQANLSLHSRDAVMAKVVSDYLERDLELLGVTGVEDKLQKDVKNSLELLRNAGVKIWMLTGDKVETARCVAVSSKLVARGQYVHTIAKMKRKDVAYNSLDFLRTNPTAALLIDGESLALLLTHHRDEFISLAVTLPAVIACRCSPTQKADVAYLIRSYTKKRVCCIGDGGNDVSMIQAADVGVGIVGKEGRQASLAADFSIAEFRYLTKLLVWHGRNSYKRSAKLAQFVIHRGLVISVCQTVYSIASEFEPNALYKDWLLVGYATLYTMYPVFSLVLDRDVDESLAALYPELYKELTSGRSLSYRTFFIWVAVSIYQGCAIQGLSQLLVPITPEGQFRRMVAVSFTALIINELVMVAVEITTWHRIMIAAIGGTAAVYLASLPFLGGYFDLPWLITPAFVWRTAVVASVALGPIWVARFLGRRIRPANYRKVRAV